MMTTQPQTHTNGTTSYPPPLITDQLYENHELPPQADSILPTQLSDMAKATRPQTTKEFTQEFI
jgi:hypothetical protein